MLQKIFLVFQEHRVWHLMQIISIGDSLHEMLNFFLDKIKKTTINLLSVEFALTAVKYGINIQINL